MNQTRRETPIYHLGQLVVYYRPSWRKVGAVTLGVLVGLLVLIAIRIRGDQNPVLFIVGWTLAACVLLLAYKVWRTARKRWLVYERGMVERNGSADEVYLWDEVESLTSYIHPGRGRSTLTFIVKRQDGKTLRIETTDLAPAPSGEVPLGAGVRPLYLVRVVNNLAFETVLEQTTARYWRGESLHFKHFQLSKAGIQVGNEVLRWSQVDDIVGNGDTVRVYERMLPSPRWMLTISDIPNRAILPDLLTRTQERDFWVTTAGARQPIGMPGYLWTSPAPLLSWNSLVASVGAILLVVGLGIGPILYQNYNSTNNRIDRANAHMLQNHNQEALAELNAAAIQSPKRALVFAARCNVYRQMGDYIAAYADCRYALSLRPGYDYALVNLGLLFYFQDQPSPAIARYNAALKRNPHFAYAICNRAFAYKMIGDLKATQWEFNNCLRYAETEDQRNIAIQELEAVGQMLATQ